MIEKIPNTVQIVRHAPGHFKWRRDMLERIANGKAKVSKRGTGDDHQHARKAPIWHQIDFSSTNLGHPWRL
jgi:hypothetical protein